MASPYKLYGGALREDAISGLQPEFLQALEQLYAAAPPEVQAELGLTSAFRDVATQQRLFEDAVRKYGSPEAARKWVAPPGRSKHNQGTAADLFGFGLSGGNVSDATRQWVHANAGQFGLGFPMAHEPWHIQMMKQVDAQMAAAGYTPEQRRNAIASIESAGSGDYAARGAWTGDPEEGRHQALGRYQVMDYNVTPWAKQYLKQDVTPDQFMADPKLQDALFDAVYGDYVKQFGERGAASKWFTGSEKEPNVTDVNKKLTGKSYADRYMEALTGTPKAGHPPNPTVGTGGYVKPGADTTPVPKGKEKSKTWKDRMKGFADAIGDMDFGANVSPATAAAPQQPAAANTTAQVPVASAEQQAAQEAQRTRLALAMQRLNQGVLF